MFETTQSPVSGFDFWAAVSIFVIAYAMIAYEKIHKTVAAIFAASLMLVLRVLTQHEAFHLESLGVDWNVIFVLISMMIIINIMKPTGVFEYVAIKSARLGKCDPVRIMIILTVMTAVLSAFLDNVTTVLLIAPVTIIIADALGVDAVPFLIMEAIASNIGGTATLIGDPPNIMIASKAHLNFMDFIIHLTPVIVIIMAALVLIIRIVFGRRLHTTEERKQMIFQMDGANVITDPVLLKKSVFVLALVLVGFVFHRVLYYEPATVTLFGAGLLLLLSNVKNPRRVLAEIEWPTIFFFIGLFVIVGGVVKVGLIRMASVKVLAITHGSLFAASMVTLWFSAIASAIVDNIPYVAAMNPLIVNMAEHLWPGQSGIELMRHNELMPIWWSLALGACLGGNGTAIGASANVIIVGMAGRAGRKITFFRFFLYGFPIMILTVLISTAYIWIRYYVL
ncbi:SLC13 family permease [Candidatus Magnetominusculus dajiuhuensis]|uniref:SLC13 family permease n=1 Tax=Candidatus Magnetominusculus dajiuhuensis TaxID=3137712 RepID=UPI003B43CDE5